MAKLTAKPDWLDDSPRYCVFMETPESKAGYRQWKGIFDTEDVDAAILQCKEVAAEDERDSHVWDRWSMVVVHEESAALSETKEAEEPAKKTRKKKASN